MEPRGLENLPKLKAYMELMTLIHLRPDDRLTVLIYNQEVGGVIEVREKALKTRLMRELAASEFNQRMRGILDTHEKSFVPVMDVIYTQDRVSVIFPHHDGSLGCVMNVSPLDAVEVERFMFSHGKHSRYPVCVACGAITDARHKCGVCRSMYCDRACQRAHWRQHKGECSPRARSP